MTQIYKILLKYIIDLNIRVKAIKLLEGKTRDNLWGIGIEFIDLAPYKHGL